MSYHKKGKVSQFIREAHEHIIPQKKTSPDRLKIRWNTIKQ